MVIQKKKAHNARILRNQLPFYHKSIDLAKEKNKRKLGIYCKKGINVTEIRNKKLVTENNPKNLETRMEFAHVRGSKATSGGEGGAPKANAGQGLCPQEMENSSSLKTGIWR